jgi:hypothetical protein
VTPATCDGVGWHGLLGFDVSNRSENERLARIWELAAAEPRDTVERLIAEGTAHSDENPEALEDFRARDDEFKECVADLLSSVLKSRELLSPCWLPHGEYPGDPEITYYASKGVDSLSEKDLLRLNRILVENALWCIGEFCETSWYSYSFEQYISYWMKLLTDIEVVDQTRTHARSPWSPREPWQSVRDPFARAWLFHPTGFLLQPDSYSPEVSDVHNLHLRRLIHPCFGKEWGTSQPPGQFSSGFHQVFPIVVQLGLMRQGELIGIENPEVHLHPSAQLEITQTLVAHAASGRLILMETHSDLVIRRVIRSVLEENLPQANVRIYFTDLEQEMHGVSHAVALRYSTLSPISIDERGRISNWPEGFLNDDIRESQRLLDIMYGGPASGTDDDE